MPTDDMHDTCGTCVDMIPYQDVMLCMCPLKIGTKGVHKVLFTTPACGFYRNAKDYEDRTSET